MRDHHDLGERWKLTVAYLSVVVVVVLVQMLVGWLT